MAVRLHPHARERMEEHGTTEDEIRATLEGGEQFPAKFGRSGFRLNFPFVGTWRGRPYKRKAGRSLRRSGRKRLAGYHGDRPVLLIDRWGGHDEIHI